MIAVIADDFTGAAEIAGIGLSYGFSVGIVNKGIRSLDTDILVVATDLRTFEPELAAEESYRITRKLLELKPLFIYKKIDSVLRGNIGVELEAQMKASCKTGALVIPANPNLNRTIREGIYYVDQKPLMESIFAQDYSFKTNSSNVVEIIKKQGVNEVYSISLNSSLPEKGLFIGNCLNSTDLDNWALRINGKLIPAGASGFFGAILSARTTKKSTYSVESFDESKKAIFICGSNFPLSKKAVAEAGKNKHTVCNMPDEIYYNQNFNPELINQWAQRISLEFNNSNALIIAVQQTPNANSLKPMEIREVIGALVKELLRKTTLNELVIEGGSTVHAIVNALEFDTFFPLQPIAPGVTRMRIGNRKDLYLTMKPGSYEWPKSIWKFNKEPK